MMFVLRCILKERCGYYFEGCEEEQSFWKLYIQLVFGHGAVVVWAQFSCEQSDVVDTGNCLVNVAPGGIEEPCVTAAAFGKQNSRSFG